MTNNISRRNILGAVVPVGSFIAVSSLLSGVATGASTPEDCWKYEPIDPLEAAEATYRLYPEGSCMYASFCGIIKSLGEQVRKTDPVRGEAILSFPFQMMKYGRGGVFDYGSLCGILNGCAAAVSLLVPDVAVAENMTGELFFYYENEPLPKYKPADSTIGSIPTAAVESVLCHISSTRWSIEADTEIASPRRKERCRRLTCDGVIKTVELLNRYHQSLVSETACRFDAVPESTAACIECHSPKGERPDASTRMACATCHPELSGTHEANR